MMDLSKIQIYIPAGMGSACRHLGLWLAGTPIEWAYGPLSSYDLVRTRNRIVQHFLKADVPRGKEYLLMIDANAVPVIPTNEIISTEGDLLYCAMVGREGKSSHCTDGDFGVQCFRVSAKLLQEMSPPWFFPPPDGDGAAKPCECKMFHERAQARGVTAKMVGIIGHLQECIVFPSPESRLGWKIAWPSELSYEGVRDE